MTSQREDLFYNTGLVNRKRPKNAYLNLLFYNLPLCRIQNKLFMFSTSDFEKLWFLYQTEGTSKGISINAYCVQQGIPYTQFYAWLRNRQKPIAKVEVEGLPSADSSSSGSHPLPELSVPLSSVEARAEGGILVSIRTRSGLHVCKGNLSYQELKQLIENLEVLC